MHSQNDTYVFWIGSGFYLEKVLEGLHIEHWEQVSEAKNRQKGIIAGETSGQ